MDSNKFKELNNINDEIDKNHQYKIGNNSSNSYFRSNDFDLLTN